MAGNMDKIQLPTNSTDISTLVRYLKGIKAVEPLNNNSAQVVYQAVKATGRKQKSYAAKVAEADGKMPARDTHTTGTLATYGLIRYIDNNKPANFVVSDLGCELISLYDADGKPLKNADGIQLYSNGKYIVMLLKVFSAWHETSKGRDIHPGKIMLQLMSDSELDYYLTEHDVAYFTSNPNFKSDNQYDEIKKQIIEFRQKYEGVYGFTSKPCKAEIFMPTFVRNWGIFEKKDIFEITPNALNPGHFIFTLKSSSITADDEIDEVCEENLDVDGTSISTQVESTQQIGNDPNGLGKSINLEILYRNVTHYALANGADVYCDMVFRQDGDYDWIYTANNKATNSTVLQPEWFKEKAKEYPKFDLEADSYRTGFLEKYGIETLKELSGKEILTKIFLNGENTDNLCCELEYNSDSKKLFGSISSGFSTKYGLYYSKKNKTWAFGPSSKQAFITENEAIIKGTEFRDFLVAGGEILLGWNDFSSIEDYKALSTKLSEVTDGNVGKIWFLKYYQMLRPEILPTIYSDSALDKAMHVLNLDKASSPIENMGIIKLFIDQCEISNALACRILWDNYPSGEEELSQVDGEGELILKPRNCLEVERSPRINKMHPLNCIIYGAPGTGKTYATAEYALAIINSRAVDKTRKTNEQRKAVMAEYNNYVRKGQVVFTTFHQSYGYEEFIQGLRPDTKSDRMSFVKIDGVFKRIADAALIDQDNNYVIIIDEINRANISKVFGELITLVEDDKRWGEVNETCATLQSGDVFAVPNNLYIIGTMNSADKSISLIDAALRRRFEFFEQYPDAELIDDTTLKSVFEKINELLADSLESSDLLIGHSYFMGKTKNDLCPILNNNIIPLLYEYFYDNKKKIIGVLNEALNGLNVEIKDRKISRVFVEPKEVEINA